ncbi:ABC transporter ATP-binding protein [Inmirania thermothiophila]|uniref:Putative ABC transport system ATP-binding protein n=1 Tax=Inmirania thermothiophila TaxID=1750597 RepID=A0A3N1Y758_9GAMM|nr:ABC transporter ATP-binding protein [Inmirania thermothiophila]ROR34605.1 putative ABC transport system ATP-binding protein [Inmirania thermothiophila]
MIRLEGVSRTFRVGGEPVHALRGVDLAVEAGEYVAIMGPSGSGKSTLLHILGLLDRPSAGRYLLDGADVGGLDDDARAALRLRRIGFVFQFFHLVPRLSAADNVALPLVLAGVAPAARRRRVAEALAGVGLAHRAAHRPDELSGGQRQRVAIARATILRPALLLADEPTGNLDRATGREVLALLERLHGEGLTLVVVTHDPAIGGRAPRLIRLEDGRIVEDRRR